MVTSRARDAPLGAYAKPTIKTSLSVQGAYEKHTKKPAR